MATVTKERLVQRMKAMKEAGEKRLEIFVRELAQNPGRTFNHSRPAFDAAAQIEVANEVLGALTAEDSKATPATVLEFTKGRVLNLARGGMPSSTSPTSNLMETCRMAAWAELFEGLDNGGLWW